MWVAGKIEHTEGTDKVVPATGKEAPFRGENIVLVGKFLLDVSETDAMWPIRTSKWDSVLDCTMSLLFKCQGGHRQSVLQ